MKRTFSVLIMTSLLLFSQKVFAQTVHDITVADFSFTPDTLTISIGDTVRWTDTLGTHNVVADDNSFTSGPIAPAPWVYTHVFTAAGSNPYYCSRHGGPGGFGMSGVIIVSSATTFQLTVNIIDGWNIVSVPGLNTPDQNVNTWWPFRDPGANVFKYSGGYQAVAAAVPGIGYWMKHSGARTYNTGDEWPAGGIQIVSHDPINGLTGWNLFGGYEQSVPTAGLTTTPPGLITGSVFKYNAGYQTAASLDPGYGYWIQLTTAGSINIPAGGPMGKSMAVNNTSTEDFGKIIITDNTLKSYTLYTINGEADLSAAVDLTQFDLPPYPPQEMFDVRYSSQRYAEKLSSTPQAIEMMGVRYPVKVRAEGIAIILSDESGKEIARLKTGEEVTLDTPGNVYVSENVIPSVYSLEQNYPNPFNPGTTIQFSIPEDVQNVKLIIYNALGEKIAELVNTGLQAGVYKYRWNAGNAASGIYMYQVITEKFVSTKKMILLK